MAEPLPPQPVPLPPIAQTVLGFVAGYVDGCTFLALFGLFVAQVTGSFVLIGTLPFAHEPGALTKVLAIPTFLLAAAVTVVIVRAIGAGFVATAVVLAIEGALLSAFLAAGVLEGRFTTPDSPLALAAGLLGLAAMGVQGALVRLVPGTSSSTNVMTTNTTQIAIDATDATLGWLRLRRHPNDQGARTRAQAARRRVAALLPIMLGFLIGTLAGAAAFVRFGLPCLLLPIGLVLAIAAWAGWRRWRSGG